jgi:hypothetical protein
MAGQRGAGANVGLAARQAGMMGAATQQNAVGQGATLQANQSLNALGAAGNIAGQQVGNQMNATQGVTNAAQGVTAGAQGLSNTALGNQAQVIGGIGAQNASNVSNAAQQTAGNVSLSNQSNQEIGSLAGGLLQGVGAAFGVYKGGEIEKSKENPKLAAVSKSDRFPSPASLPPHLAQISTIYHGTQIPQPPSPPKFSNGGLMKEGGGVPGQAKLPGDHPSNDTVDAKLSPGEMVIPKSVMESKDPAGEAAKFVASHLKNKGSSQPESDFKTALAKAMKNRKKAA